MEQKDWKVIFIAICAIGVWMLGFYFGRKTMKDPEPKTVIEYVEGDPIRDTIIKPVPYKVVEPIDTASIISQCIKDGIYKELWPERTITEYIEVTKQDTTALLADWATKRFYSETLFDTEENGRCSFNAEVQYNRMNVISYEYTPVVKTVTKTEYVKKAFSPFVGAGLLSNPWDENPSTIGTVAAGAFIKDKWGLQLQYQKDFSLKNDYLGGIVMIKF